MHYWIIDYRLTEVTLKIQLMFIIKTRAKNVLTEMCLVPVVSF